MIKKGLKMAHFNSIKNLNLHKKRIFLRTDLNIPTEKKQILQDFKLKSALPTLDFILKNGGKVVLGTHIGRPDANAKTNFYDDELSTQILIPWFQDRGYNIEYEPDLLRAKTQSHLNHSSILLLENLRFFNGEKNYSLQFAELLAATADLYVNDAFGAIHREDTSVTLLVKQFAKQDRAFGLLIEQELQKLERIRNNTSQNFIIVIGGIKLKDKLPMLRNLIMNDQAVKPKSIIIGGALGLAFFKDLNIQSPVLDDATLKMAEQITQMAALNKINLLLPTDQIIVKGDEIKSLKIDQLSENDNCVDVGPETIKSFSDEISSAEVIFCNGTMGIYTEPRSKVGTQQILEAVANSKAFKVIGGGDATAATCMFGLENKMDFLSTGGGATLKYLGCKDPGQEMPGLRAMIYE